MSENKSRSKSVLQSPSSISKKLNLQEVEQPSLSKSNLEPSAPGIGAPVTGYKLRKTIATITSALDYEIDE